MTESELAVIEARANAAMPGPWRWKNPCGERHLVEGLFSIAGPLRDGSESWQTGLYPILVPKTAEAFGSDDDEDAGVLHDNLAFIAHARTDVPALVAEVRRLRALVEYSAPPGVCPHEDCDGKTPATKLVRGRGYTANGEQIGHPWIAYYCDKHAPLVMDEGNPEYVEGCPNCGCRFGIN